MAKSKSKEKSQLSVGRPKEYDRIKIGQDFLKWAKENPDAFTVPMFAATIGLHSGILRNWSRESEEFRVLFMAAKEQIGINRLKATLENSIVKLDNSIYRAHVGNYDVDINEYMREEKEFESSLKATEVGASQSTYIIQVPHDLAIGSDLPAPTLPAKNTKGSK